MRIIIQRVTSASVRIDSKLVNEISQGFLLLVAVEDTDSEFDLDYAVRKVTQMRVFSDAEGKMNRSVQDISGEILSISQFTLFADTRKGNRPGFSAAGKPEFASQVYDKFNAKLNEVVPVRTGVFGADMQIELTNDGPVTIPLDTSEARPR